MNDILSRHQGLLCTVEKEDYYVDIVAYNLEMFKRSIKTPEDVCTFWNNVWSDLPDSPAIRRTPFFEICELAEGEYLMENDNE